MQIHKPKYTYLAQLFILIGLVIAGMIVAGIIQFIMTLFIVDLKTLMSGDSEKLMQILLLPKNAAMMKWMQVLGTIALFFIPTWGYAKIVNKNPWKHLGFKSPINTNQILLVVGVAFAGLFLSGALGELNEIIPIPAKWAAKFKAMEETYSTQVMAMATMKSFGEYIIAMIIIAILPAIFEEMLFRAGFQQIIEKLSGSIIVSLIVTSFIFSVIHFSYYGFLPRMGLGVVLGLIFYYSKI